MGPVQCAMESMTDTGGIVVHDGENYIMCHYLEWKHKTTGVYKVENTAVNYVASHLVCIGHLQRTRVVGGY